MARKPTGNKNGRPKGAINRRSMYDRCRIFAAHDIMKAEGFKRCEILDAIENELSIGQKKTEKALAIKNRIGYHTLRFSNPILKDYAAIISDQDLLDAVISFLLDAPLPKFDPIK